MAEDSWRQHDPTHNWFFPCMWISNLIWCGEVWWRCWRCWEEDVVWSWCLPLSSTWSQSDVRRRPPPLQSYTGQAANINGYILRQSDRDLNTELLCICVRWWWWWWYTGNHRDKVGVLSISNQFKTTNYIQSTSEELTSPGSFLTFYFFNFSTSTIK